MGAWSFSHTDGGDAKSFHLLKDGGRKVSPCLKGGGGGGANSFGPSIFPFNSPPCY